MSRATMHTNRGPIEIELYAGDAPLGLDYLVKVVESGEIVGTEFGRVVPNFCVQALRGDPITIYGDGSQTRSFCFVSDLVDGFLALTDLEGLSGEIVNLGNPIE